VQTIQKGYVSSLAILRAHAKSFRYLESVLFAFFGILLHSPNAAAQQTIWPATSVPATVDNGPDGPVELGVLFRSDVSGTITGIRFYKSAANTGAHQGHLWSQSGALLASVTFAGETASGWQQANFSTPVSISANTVYIASYQSSVGHWSVNWNYFAAAGTDNPPLHALQNATGTPNGVWGVAGTFPKNSNGSNYWVDVAFSSAIPPVSAVYGFNEGSGTSTADASGNGNTATLAGASWTAVGRYANGLSFNGSTGYLEAANSKSLNPATAATFSAWINLAAANSNISSIINKWSQTADDEYLFGLDSTNRLLFAWQTTGGNAWGKLSYNLVFGNARIPLGTWTYVSVVRNGASISFYVNGNLDVSYSSVADNNPFRSGINTLRIGAQSRGGMARVLNGTIDEVRMYNRALTAPQIQSDMTTPIAPPSTATAPSITTQPVGQSVTAGQSATFSIAATGTAPLACQWQKNGGSIAGATSFTYTTPPATASDNGAQFSAVISNAAGTVSSNSAKLTINVPPSITAQPANQAVVAGQSATFSVAASGTAPLAYQWNKNGVAIVGATSPSYITPSTTVSDNGAGFSVTVTNAVGTAISNSASLTVNAATYLLSANPSTLNFANVNTGSTGFLPVTLTNTGNSNVTLSAATVTGSGFSATGLTSGTVLSPNQSTTLNVTFTPVAAGSVSGSVAVASNATNSPEVISVSGTGVQPSAASFPAWVVSSLLRVGKSDPAGSTSSVALSSARGETVDTQIIVQGISGGLSNVNVSASALTGPNGATIPASNITLYREYYITVTGTASYGGGSNPPQGSGTYPEPLIPFNDPETGAALCATSAVLKACNAGVPAGQNQPYWIDISVPRGATDSPAGTYTGTITITADQGSATIPVTLAVWNFELPAQPSELSLWTLWPPAAGNTLSTLNQALMRNKVMGWYDTASNAAGDIANFGLNRSGLDGYYFIGIQCNGSYSSLPSTSQINAAAANFTAGLGLDFYLADEVNGCTGAYGPIKTLSANAHAANRSVKTMITLDAVDPNLYGYVDHWVLLNSVQKWPALPFTNGDLWSYTSCNTGYGNTPEWLMDYPPINERIQAGFLNFTQGATGILYYRADGWTATNTINSWNNVNTTACGGGLARPGDGIFLYPPAPIGSTESAPGIRLKAIRDGIQDYQYAQMLKDLGQFPVLNSVVLPIATSWTNWTHDPAALENARQQLGQQLHLLNP
jgi:Domain of unknown function (DUF4082)/Concanavalin A-like lectin/glucanases superfamily/Domain of unknown function (DUF4091)/Abnormal spindle-like microcephaly-assoc'd, ASPM-SPD-2-Hydin